MQQVISKFKPISLEEMKSVKLMNRIDTKFVTTLPRLLELLEMARSEYRIQEINGERNMLYHTVYFDTPDCDMYRIHQTGHSGRQKVRARSYVASNLHFLEVKTKNNHGRTKKKRIEINSADLLNTPLAIGENGAFLKKTLHYDAQTLSPTMDNLFDRITLVNNRQTERLTIDTNLRFHNVETNCDWYRENLVIVELKRDGLCYSPILEMLRQLRILPHGFSKYCMGSAFTNENLPVNRFKPKIIDVKKILDER